VNNVYSQPEKLPSPVNGSWSIYNACIAPDESYLIGCVSGKDTTLPKKRLPVLCLIPVTGWKLE